MTKALFLSVGFASALFAALPNTTIFEVRQAGSNSNSGCFVEGATGTDFSQQNAAQYTFADLASVNGTTNPSIVTSASHSFVAADVGNCLRVTAGTNWTTGVYQIVSVAAGAATLDRAVGTAAVITAGTYFVGGALATLAQLNTNMCSACRAWVKADATYTITANVTFNYSTTNQTWVAGYTTTRGDGGRFTVQATGSIGDWMITLSNANFRLSNIVLDVNGQANSRCILFSSINDIAQNVECKNGNAGNAMILINNVRDECRVCWVHDWAGGQPAFSISQGDGGLACIYCTAGPSTANGESGFLFQGGACSYCTVYGLTGTTTDGFLIGSQGKVNLDHCVAYNVTRNGINITVVTIPVEVTNCVLSTTLTGINNTSGTTLRPGDTFANYNFFFNNGTNVSGLTMGANSVILTADPFTNAAAANFTLNTTAGGGAAVTNAGAPSSLLGVTGTGYPAGGVLQPQVSAGGSGGGSAVFR